MKKALSLLVVGLLVAGVTLALIVLRLSEQTPVSPTPEQTPKTTSAHDELTEEQERLLALAESVHMVDCPPIYTPSDSGYQVNGGCLYHSGIDMFEHTFLYAMITGELGEEGVERALDPSSSMHAPVGGFSEDFRFEDNGKLYIYLQGTLSCTGCYFGGMRFVIDKAAGTAVRELVNAKASVHSVHYPGSMYAVEVDEVESSDVVNIVDLRLPNPSETPVLTYKVPSEFTVVKGCYHNCLYSIAWIDARHVRLDLMPRDAEGKPRTLPTEPGEEVLYEYAESVTLEVS